MRLIAEGRASAIYDLGDGRVLRRSRFDGWERGLPHAVAYRLADPNVTPEERERVRTAAYPKGIV